jgi:hypothetical protein
MKNKENIEIMLSCFIGIFTFLLIGTIITAIF